MRRLKTLLLSGKTWVIATPFMWLILFFLVPFAIIFKISFSKLAVSIPPYEDLLRFVDHVIYVTIDIGNYLFLFTDDLYGAAYLDSLRIAFFSTIGCLVIGYPMAYGIARSSPSVRNILLMLIVLPSWTSFLIRVYAWIGILKNNGIINNILISLGIISEPFNMLHTNFAVYVGIIYAYLPFMILPLYANFMKMDVSLLDAAADLGARPWKAFWTITVPLSQSGIVAGSMLVFIPVVGEFVIPDLLGGPDTLMVGKILWQEFFSNRDWPLASAVAVAMLALLVIPIYFFSRYQKAQLRTAQ